jgi:hypothetical protein
MTKHFHLWQVLPVIAMGLFALAPDVAARQTPSSAAQELSERYSPIAELRQQMRACDRDGEGYYPAPVETVLSNSEIALKQATGKNSRSDTILMMGPTAKDLAGKDISYYLDFPGNPNHPGCQYEQAFKRYVSERNAPPTTYAHIVVDPERGKLVLQYWFWYYFNEWNNSHESDLEMMQIVAFENRVPALGGVVAALLVALISLFVVKRQEIGEAFAV